MLPEGLVLVDKPIDWTSFDVVNYLKNYFSQNCQVSRRQIKIGHTGTLDPFATGLIIILIGKKFTSKASYFLGLDKSYYVKLLLGSVSDSYDVTGSIKKQSSFRPEKKQILQAILSFEGRQWQTPPSFSAIKINGIRAYRLARQHKEVNLSQRLVYISDIKNIGINYPLVEFEVTVSSGTYIRSLVNDLGRKLKTGALTTELRRLRVGSYKIEQACSIDQIKNTSFESFVKKYLLSDSYLDIIK
jgi:tRNA pseudouridine55 synthase